jgi:hypothetical protein
MKKIKLICFFAFFCISCNFLFAETVVTVAAQSSVEAVQTVSPEVSASNTRIAERYLNSAEKYLFAENWNSAFSQAELGLHYDNTISDLYYIKALAMTKKGEKRADVYAVIKQAIEKDKWTNYNRNGARILYGDILSDLGLYDESLAVLDQKPFIYSADAEFIRIKNYYRMGTADSISQARAKLNSVRKVYPADTRFPKLFFMFEVLFMNRAEMDSASNYEIPEIVKSISTDYINRIPDYDNNDIDTEVMALLFADGQQQTRLLKAVGEKNSNSPLYAYAGLKTGILSEEKAYNLFFESSADNYNLDLLKAFAALIQNEGLQANLHDRLNSFTGTLFVDEELDLRIELTIQYERGRPVKVSYDADNDDVLDLQAECDFGVPVRLEFHNADMTLEYNSYPAVKQIEMNEQKMLFNFLDKDFSYEPFDMTAEKLFTQFNVNFFIPYINREVTVPEEYMLAKKASSVVVKTNERRNSEVRYSVYDGMPVYAAFYEASKRYAYASMEAGYPFVRYVDTDGDEYFETIESYDFSFSKKFISDESKQLVNNVFGDNVFSADMFLLSVEIDRNGNTINEFKEEYTAYNGKKTFWDNDDDGHWDCAYIRHSDESNSGILREEAIFYDKKGNEIVSLVSENGTPSLISYMGNQYPVITGEKKSLYWLEQKGDSECEEIIEKDNWKGYLNGAVKLIEYKDNVRLFVIRIDSSVYCRLVPESLSE